MSARSANAKLESLDLPPSRQPENASALSVEIIDSITQIQSLQEPWQSIYRRDPESGFFLSYDWISALFEQYPSRMRVLAIRGTDGGYLGFFPISTRVRWSRSVKKFQTVLEPGGRAALSELTGILVDPVHEKPVLNALAGAIAALPWTRFTIRYEPTGRRSRILLDALPADQFKGRFRSYLINDDTIDNLSCPQVHLPDSHEAWLVSLSSNTRQKIRRFSRRHLASGDWRVTQTSAETLQRDLDIVLDLWTQRWVGEKGKSGARRTTTIYRHMFETAHAMGMLHLPVLWAGDNPLVAHACIADRSRGHVHFVAAGRSVDHDQPNSGLLLHSESMGWAIDSGFSVYDFGHGDEAYKASLGGQNKKLHYLYVERISDDPKLAIDPFNLSGAKRKIRACIEAGPSEDGRIAGAAFSKIVEAHRPHDEELTKLISKMEAQYHG